MVRMPLPGEPTPWFHAATLDGGQRYAFDLSGGRWVVLLLMGSAARGTARAALRLVQQHRALFDDRRAAFFGVTVDPQDAAESRIARQMPGIRWFLDYERRISTLYGAAKAEDADAYAPYWLLLDPMLRVHARAPLAEGDGIFAALRAQLAEPVEPAEPATAPVLVVPGVLPPELCRRLIGEYDRHGGRESGFMREENGITVERLDPYYKRRADHRIDDQDMVALLKARLGATLRPLIRHVFQFDATRIERFMVACYDAASGGHFRAHRDNTTKGTAHRKFACTINLNAEEFEGGDLWFPEFGPRTYRAPTGGAVVFSCSLLHEAKPVTAGRRYAFLPFLYDEEGARIREINQPHIAPELQGYRSGLTSEGSAPEPSLTDPSRA